MGGFLKKNTESSVIEFTVPVGAVEATHIQKLVQIILENTNTDELEILAKVSLKPLVKSQAIKEARKYVS